ncbi:MAG: polyisoprenoid-binding protein [Candidatus Dormibacteraeota bacterium]|nr:polyisoprenoid-binding protein [Candidatus Dormibacteraeota bacterium]
MATTYTIDPLHTRIGFAAKHMVVSTVRGQFNDYAATLEVEDESDPRTARLEVVIKTASIDTGADDRDNHLRSDDFFNAEQYPEIRFTSTSIERRGQNEYRVTGDLTIRDVTKAVTLDAEVEGPITDPWGNERVGVTLTGQVNRFEWNLRWNAAIETGGLIVSDQIRIQVEAEFTSAPRPAQASQ